MWYNGPPWWPPYTPPMNTPPSGGQPLTREQVNEGIRALARARRQIEKEDAKKKEEEKKKKKEPRKFTTIEVFAILAFPGILFAPAYVALLKWSAHFTLDILTQAIK